MTYIFPKNLFAGFKQRDKCTVGFINYVTDKGSFKFQKSWETWRDKKASVQEWQNVPTSGFVINKNVKRDSHFGGNEYIRIWHPLGFEFEVSVGVLERLLSFVNLSMGEITTPCVLGFSSDRAQKIELISTLDPMYNATLLDNTTYQQYSSNPEAKPLVTTIGEVYEFQGQRVIYLGKGEFIPFEQRIYTSSANKKNCYYNVDEHKAITLKTKEHAILTTKTVSRDEINHMNAYLRHCFISHEPRKMGTLSCANSYKQDIRQLHFHHAKHQEIVFNDNKSYVIAQKKDANSLNDTKTFFIFDQYQWYICTASGYYFILDSFKVMKTPPDVSGMQTFITF